MALKRYEIRNEYSLADPELYRAADKDDPEALLEGVAMAGLVGVLRQLGDLAEFAAEIFHNLHEEVMATSARGHGLTLRVQQLEAEFPSLEKAFLSQTSHSLFLHNPGVVWHPNLKLDQSLITQGDLPRFVMDSYEECRGPPRLFLLDKFDVAGAGACLKRYTDPSFFKAEFTSSEAAKEELKREKKARKMKKKGSRWRPGENPELAASHFKLHQLLLEERNESQNNAPMHRVKLKRRYSDKFLGNSVSGKSYMEKFLNSHSRDAKSFSESSVHSRLKMGSSDSSGLVPEREIVDKSFADHLGRRDRNLMQSRSREEKTPKGSSNMLHVDDERNSYRFLESAPEMELESTFYRVEDKKELVVDAKGNAEASADEFHSDDANSEIDNYADALATMDSEGETDTESKPNKERSVKIEMKCVENEEKTELQVQFQESQSVGSSISLEDGNDSSEIIRLSPSYSDTFGTAVGIVPSDAEVAAKAHPSIGAQYVNISSKTGIEARNDSVTRSPESAVPNASPDEVSEIPSYSSKFQEASSDSDDAKIASGLTISSLPGSQSDSQLFHPNPIVITFDVARSVSEQMSPKSEGGVGGCHDLSYMTSVSDILSQSKHDFLSEGSLENQTVGMFNSENLVASDDISVHQSDIMDTIQEDKGIVGDSEELFSSCVADSSHKGTQMMRKLSSPDSVLLNTEEEIYGLAEKEFKASPGTRWVPESRPDPPTVSDMNGGMPGASVSDLEEVTRSGDKAEYLSSVLSSMEIHYFREQEDPKITDHALSLERDTAAVGTGNPDVDVSLNKLESKMSDCFGSEMETPCNNMEFNMSDHEVKDGHAAERANFMSAVFERTRNTDNVLPLEHTSSYNTESVTSEEVPLEVAKSYAEAKVEQRGPIGSNNEETYLDFLGSAGASTTNGSEGGREMENDPIASDFSIQQCSPELADEVHDPPTVECTQTHLDSPEGAIVTLSTEENNAKETLHQCSHVKETSSPSTISLETGAVLEHQENYAKEDHLCVLQQKGQNIESRWNDYELAESLDHVYSDRCSTVPFESSSIDPLSQSVNLNISSRTRYGFERSVPSVFPVQPISQSFSMPSTSNQLPWLPRHKSVSDGSLAADDAVLGDVEEMPPLPPLPPMQWRVGKPRHDSHRGEVIQPISNAPSTNSREAVDLAASHHDESADPPKPFLENFSSDAEVSKDQSQEVLHANMSLSPPVDSAVEHNLILEPTIVESQNQVSPLTDGDLQHDSLIPRDEIPESSILGPSTSASNTENSNIQHGSQTPKEEWGQPLDSLVTVENDEEHELHHAFLDTEHVSTASTTSESNENGHYSQTLDGELRWQSNSAVISTMDYGNPNGTLKSRLARPRDPLIEAVASHDKRNLRKVTERVIPHNGPEVDERNSLLEQIRTKSFSLKPAVATRPSIHGPKTNLKVVAILEKANAIRQALAGSDEDDDDSWSDS